jgi:hypothetical protein
VGRKSLVEPIAVVVFAVAGVVMNQLSIIRILGGITLGLVLALAGAGIVVFSGIKDSQARALEWNAPSGNIPDIRVPDGAPALSESSIKTAMMVYGIKSPTRFNGPFIDFKMEDRGLTVRKGVNSIPTVYVGPEAFSSWALLGSTLAHEIEVHCRQNFLAIHFQNLAGFDGTGMAEREAYRYELANASRFGLAQYDQDLIRGTMNYFYPEVETASARRWSPFKVFIERLSASSIGAKSL